MRRAAISAARSGSSSAKLCYKKTPMIIIIVVLYTHVFSGFLNSTMRVVKAKLPNCAANTQLDRIHLKIVVLYLLKGVGGKVKQLIEVGRFCCI